MSLNIEGALIKKSKTITKESKAGKEFNIRIFAIETGGDYPQKVKFQLFGDRCDLMDNYEVGQSINVHFDIRGNEWEGKIINSLNAWKIEASNKAEQQPEASTTEASDLDLPF